MGARSVAAVCREIMIVKSTVGDPAVREQLIADLQEELAAMAALSRSRQRPVAASGEGDKASKDGKR